MIDRIRTFLSAHLIADAKSQPLTSSILSFAAKDMTQSSRKSLKKLADRLDDVLFFDFNAADPDHPVTCAIKEDLDFKTLKTNFEANTSSTEADSASSSDIDDEPRTESEAEDEDLLANANGFQGLAIDDANQAVEEAILADVLDRLTGIVPLRAPARGKEMEAVATQAFVSWKEAYYRVRSGNLGMSFED